MSTQQLATEVIAPVEGGIYEENGRRYRFESVPTSRMVFDPKTGQSSPQLHTLRTWFAHFTDEAGPGPGWDGRWGLDELSRDQMLKRYGHVFTLNQIDNPAGRLRFNEVGPYREGGMPDITYFALVPIDDE